MFHHRIDDEDVTTVFHKWYLLSFMSGAVNAGAVLGVQRFVTHVTGFASLFGVALGQGNFDQALGMLLVPFFFLSGTMISAYLVDHRFHQGREPHYDWVMLLVFTCLVAVAVGGHFGFIGDDFGGQPRLRQDFTVLALLCMASGLQNAAITTASGASVRTTHLTGLTTDLGIGLVRVFGTKASTREHKQESRTNLLRLGTIGSFGAGGALGTVLFLRFHYLGFLLPAAIALYAMIQARKEHPKTALA